MLARVESQTVVQISVQSAALLLPSGHGELSGRSDLRRGLRAGHRDARLTGETAEQATVIPAQLRTAPRRDDQRAHPLVLVVDREGLRRSGRSRAAVGGGRARLTLQHDRHPLEVQGGSDRVHDRLHHLLGPYGAGQPIAEVGDHPVRLSRVAVDQAGDPLLQPGARRDQGDGGRGRGEHRDERTGTLPDRSSRPTTTPYTSRTRAVSAPKSTVRRITTSASKSPCRRTDKAMVKASRALIR